MKTYSAKAEDFECKRKWWLVDAKDKTLGRLSTEVARVLRGKHRAEYTPHVDTGDYVVVINADKIKVTGNKVNDKIYYRHTGYPGGIKEISFGKLLMKAPIKIIEIAVKGMLPKTILGRQMFRKLKVYAGPEHRHQAQKLEALEIKTAE